MLKHIRLAVEKHALEAYPRECCGLVIRRDRRQTYIPCENTAEKDQDFKIRAEEYASAEDLGEVVAVVHSHIDRSAKPTQQDKLSCEALGIPWHIVSVLNDLGEKYIGGWDTYEPQGYEAPLVGREFRHGTTDCYGVIRDFFRRELGVELLDFERAEDWWKDPNAEEMYLDNFEKAGFREVLDDSLQFGDVFLIQYNANKVNHGGIFLGNASLKTQPALPLIQDAMLHHPQPRLSERVIYGGMWRNNTRKVVRHETQWKN